ncbi:SpoIIE family protein phosphatase [Spirochaeta isovalerica]|uniref:Serine/threonine protein phosphatase PrpC n=1 Tax=Spirochaeta isovalerica TaxID=150 RepID=A0A841RJJ0_9SPIO|nr:SpoIIE family protein phosphatase [Spirochaeta isovalerica]MBB6482462.1 serine/threonine protein phosphatase PrpC [Spirochaeta isovalerica]
MSFFIEVDYSQYFKEGQSIGGDVFLLSKGEERDRIICTLSDGLGSGVKANVLANLTAHMAQKYAAGTTDMVKSAEIIMNTLPVCRERKISYSTFTILRMENLKSDKVRASIVEYDNPGFLLIRDGACLCPEKTRHELKRPGAFKDENLFHTELELEAGDRIIFFTDGITQAGLGTKQLPLGWRAGNVKRYILELLNNRRETSAYELASAVTAKARALDIYKAKDDITCASVYIRKPRRLIVSTGPPIDESRDEKLVKAIADFDGRKVIAGGTTAQIYSRITGKKLKVALSDCDGDLPPCASMEGVDLVTEGMLTLNRIAGHLEKRISLNELPRNSAGQFLKLLLESDQVRFLVGTKINDAHQDPSIPFEIGIRRSIIGRIVKALEENYLKETELEFI